MNMKAFDKSPEVAPLLVRLYESHKLYALAEDDQPQARAELTGVVSDLLDVQLSGREQEMLADVLITLMRQAERDLRRAMAERLAVMDNVPLRLVLFLANDEITVASPVLRQSRVLSDLDLVYIIKSQGPDYWQAIATREQLSAHVVDALADTRDTGTAVMLAQNERAVLTDYALQVLAGMAQAHEDVARPLLSRKELPLKVARELYAHVGTQLKAHIRTYYGEDAAAPLGKVFDDIFVEFADQKASSEFLPGKTMMEAAERYAMAGLLNMQLVMDTIKRGQIASFIALFAKYSGLTPKRVHDMLMQSCPKGMAIACRAFGIQKGDFSNIYIMTHRMRSRGRMVDHRAMLDALAYFDTVKPEVAMRIVRTTTVKD
ncbi:MAG: DUF2336 domain-containing protein [Alphaproteobacteria bacterium]|nr:DUF2336 domain-containing protein [Alphaproteobacteria bacterium]MBU0860079.1 DUF2336 domain-containing protein [Alphaproteobacteria bacterium]